MICFNCKKDLPEDDFVKNKSKKTGLSHLCKLCKRTADKDYYKNNEKRRKRIRVLAETEKVKVQKLIEDFLLSHPCEICGNKDIRVLCFHHKDPMEKELNISETSYSVNKIKKEIEKCLVLCANCHRILHYEERKSGIDWSIIKKNARVS